MPVSLLQLNHLYADHLLVILAIALLWCTACATADGRRYCRRSGTVMACIAFYAQLVAGPRRDRE